ncbi:PRC and DUF2382 domain-containing protein [Actinomycetospora sp. NBRC 106378]|uniref:PRC and DUF2382 domain-containing protein n=1 Tax=Actinomycetospora sp. NBRC 106378 TaxID=3032208 RepID=UPI0024A2F2A9|nr:PRC and DUF2382 domain-containing protein [Actinomycetospora sp. NBRC 106378]GLZ54166.1 hypothetical protein Acsp07_37830 [Actinomycetospora sp. NBRC 106378]
MTITPDMVKDLRGTQVFDRDDEKIGKVGEVYVDNSSGEPKWVTVNTGLFGTTESFVPLDGAKQGRDGLHVAPAKKMIKDAPRSADDSGELSETGERELYDHYGLAAPTGRHGDADARRQDGRDRDQRTDRHGDQGMTLSEERLAVGKESVETGRVRLRKYVVTENQTVEVPVSHEEVRLEREPVRDGARPGSIGEDEQTVTLHAERATVDKQAHAVENVRLATETVTENQTFSEDVRKERVDVDDENGVMTDGKKRRH